jgi:hypothetical protein
VLERPNSCSSALCRQPGRAERSDHPHPERCSWRPQPAPTASRGPIDAPRACRQRRPRSSPRSGVRACGWGRSAGVDHARDAVPEAELSLLRADGSHAALLDRRTAGVPEAQPWVSPCGSSLPGPASPDLERPGRRGYAVLRPSQAVCLKYRWRHTLAKHWFCSPSMSQGGFGKRLPLKHVGSRPAPRSWARSA